AGRRLRPRRAAAVRGVRPPAGRGRGVGGRRPQRRRQVEPAAH
ncbi:MAG: hypothetical protein AVDCRST_MAG91-275, partial [uncultured Sphingomonadaceae bacterium]